MDRKDCRKYRATSTSLPTFFHFKFADLPFRDPGKLLSLSKPACSVYCLESLAQYKFSDLISKLETMLETVLSGMLAFCGVVISELSLNGFFFFLLCLKITY